MYSNDNYLAIAKSFIPPKAEIKTIPCTCNNSSNKHKAILCGNLLEEKHSNPDSNKEIVVLYRLKHESYMMILTKSKDAYKVIVNEKLKHNHICYFDIAHFTNENKCNIILGYQLGPSWNRLAILTLHKNKLKSVLKKDLYYSSIEFFTPKDCPNNARKHMAIWCHHINDVYDVDILKWGRNNLEIAKESYNDYFNKVVDYYKSMIRLNPDKMCYWYYLANAEFNAGLYNDGLASIEKALKSAYPSKDKITDLKNLIITKLSREDGPLFPAPVRDTNGKRVGYIDSLGNFKIMPKYDYGLDFQPNNLAIVGIDNSQGVINTKGNYVVPPIYDGVSGFSEGRGVIFTNSGAKLINEEGKILTDKPYGFIGSFSDGRVLASNSGEDGKSRYGYLNRDGFEVIPLKYEDGSDFKNNKAVVKNAQNDFSLINVDGVALYNYKYNYVGNYGEGLLAYEETPDSKFGFIKENGDKLISPRFSGVESFKDSRSIVNISENYSNEFGLIDTSGNFIYKPIYNSIINLGNNRVALGNAINPSEPYVGSIYALGDLDGNILTKFKYYNINNFKDSLASVYDGMNTYFIDEKGAIKDDLPIINGNGQLRIENGIIQGFVDFRTSYYDKLGKLIWKENSIIPLSNNRNVLEIKFNPNKDFLVYYPEISGLDNIATTKKINEELKSLSNLKEVSWNTQLNYSYYGDYLIEFYQKNLLVPSLFGYEYYFGAAHGNPIKTYPHINLITGEFYSLGDLFKKDSNYVEDLSKIINEKIKTDKTYNYIYPDETIVIKPNQPFYVDNNNLFIYFTPYEIAPYAAGFPTFKIPFNDIMYMIDTTGSFWQSFK